jgi:carbon-monoxide dehydrogenase medium subunit
MRDFDFKAPATLAEALSVLAEAKGEARCLAGGSDLIDQIRGGRKTPSIVVDVKRIPELTRLEYTAQGLYVGAAVPCARIYNNPQVKERYPILAQATALVGDVKIQNRAGIGGNLCNAAPSADTAPAVIVLGGIAQIASRRGNRQVPVEQFMTGPGRNCLEPDELLVAITIPTPAANSAGCYLRLTPRNEMDIAVAGVGALIVSDGRGRCKEARIALGAVAPTPVRAREAESFLAGKALNDANIERASEEAKKAAKPISDIRSSAEYRVDMVAALTRKTLRACAAALKS